MYYIVQLTLYNSRQTEHSNAPAHWWLGPDDSAFTIWCADISIQFTSSQFNIPTQTGDTWRESRQLFGSVINQRTNSRFYPMMEKAGHRLLHYLLEKPEAFPHHIES